MEQNIKFMQNIKILDFLLRYFKKHASFYFSLFLPHESFFNHGFKKDKLSLTFRICP